MSICTKWVPVIAAFVAAACSTQSLSSLNQAPSPETYVYRNGLNQQIVINFRKMTVLVGDKTIRLRSCSREGLKCVESKVLKFVAPDKCQEGTFSHLETLQRLGVRFFSMDGTHGAAFYSANGRSGYSYDPFDGVVRIFLLKPEDLLNTEYDPTDRPREVFDLQQKVGPFGCMRT